MAGAVDQTQLKRELFEILDETFERHHGIFLDKGTSLFETLRTIDSRQASVPVGATCASLAAQVAHVTLYLRSWSAPSLATTRARWTGTRSGGRSSR